MRNLEYTLQRNLQTNHLSLNLASVTLNKPRKKAQDLEDLT